MLNYDHSQQDVFDAVNSVLGALNRFRAAALQEGAVSQGVLFDDLGYPCEGNKSELLISAVCKWDVADESENGNVLRFPGVFEVSDDLLNAIGDLNQSKSALELKAGAIISANARDRQNKLREIFKRQGLGRTHPLQCWRLIHVIDHEEIKTIGFSTINKSIGSEVMTKAEALRRLERRDAQDIIEELEGEVCSTVRWVTPVSPFVRANVSYWVNGALTNKSIHASLPLIVRKGSWPEKVKFNVPRVNPVTRSVDPEEKTKKINLRFRENAYLALS
ncbi:hypothetical protein ACEN2T_17535 [Pseudomonas sp. W22_MBD1_FP4]|uniref:hypothetical protein n=1 Tax=Pseudomonas sp. W22_MBD1_FP4 TaxID=3240272 RepID=UPI003F9C5277